MMVFPFLFSFYFRRIQESIYFIFVYFILGPRRELGFWILSFDVSVLIVPSVFDLIWGVWGFPVEIGRNYQSRL